MDSSQIKVIELKKTYKIVAARNILDNSRVYLDLFSWEGVWVLFIRKNDLGIVRKFLELNKEIGFSYFFLVFSGLEKVRNEIKFKSFKERFFWVDKKEKNDIFKELKVCQLPWVVFYKEGVAGYSAHDFPEDISDLNNFYEAEEREIDENQEEIDSLKKKSDSLKRIIKKQELKVLSYKNEVFELKNTEKKTFAEVQDLKKKIKNYEKKIPKLPEPDIFNYLQDQRSQKKSFFDNNLPINTDIWRNGNSSYFSDEASNLWSKNLWINNIHQNTSPVLPSKKPSRSFIRKKNMTPKRFA